MALLEAMARGLPSIATNIGANQEILEDSCGIIIPVADANQAILAIQKLQSIELRNSMSRCAIEKVRANYTANAVLTTILQQIYKQLL